jgi:hypothetical protein
MAQAQFAAVGDLGAVAADQSGALRRAGQPSFLRSNFQRGVKQLPISWTA